MNVAATVPGAKESASVFRREVLDDLKSVIVGELAQHGQWIVTNILTNSFWPIAAQKVRWRGVDIWIIPITKSSYPTVAMMMPPGKGRAECEELVMRFLSMLSWSKSAASWSTEWVAATCRDRWADSKRAAFRSATSSI